MSSIDFGSEAVWRRELRATLGLIAFGWRSANADGVSKIAIGSVFVGLVIILSGLYRITPFEELGTDVSLTYGNVVWYMTLTELVAISVWVQFREVREEVMNGQLEGRFIRPTSYLRLKLSEWLGRTANHFVYFGAIGFVLAFLLTGNIAMGPVRLGLFMISTMLGAAIFCALHVMVGLTEVWGPYSRPLFMMVQKTLFLLGGLLIPLDIYPAWMQTAAWATPFPAILYVPASLALGKPLETFGIALVGQIIWLGLALALAVLVLQRTRARIGAEGV